MKAAAAQGSGPHGAFTPTLSAPERGCWEVFLADHELPIVIPATVPEARVRQLCAALQVPYRYRPASA